LTIDESHVEPERLPERIRKKATRGAIWARSLPEASQPRDLNQSARRALRYYAIGRASESDIARIYQNSPILQSLAGNFLLSFGNYIPPRTVVDTRKGVDCSRPEGLPFP